MADERHRGGAAPKNKANGQAIESKILSGKWLTVKAFTAEYLGPDGTEGQARSKVNKQLIPFRKWGGRIYFVRSELDDYFRKLEGVTVEQALENERRRREARE